MMTFSGLLRQLEVFLSSDVFVTWLLLFITLFNKVCFKKGLSVKLNWGDVHGPTSFMAEAQIILNY